MTGTPLKWDFVEQWSCSGRLSTQALKRLGSVGFPVDYRYGWDLKSPRHRRLLDEVHSMFSPKVTFSAPDCKLYSRARRTTDQEKQKAERESEVPMLNW